MKKTKSKQNLREELFKMAQRGDAVASKMDAQKYLPDVIKVLKEQASLGELSSSYTFGGLAIEIPALRKKSRSGEGVLVFLEETAKLLIDLGLDVTVRKMNLAYEEHHSIVIEWDELKVSTGELSGTA